MKEPKDAYERTFQEVEQYYKYQAPLAGDVARLLEATKKNLEGARNEQQPPESVIGTSIPAYCDQALLVQEKHYPVRMLLAELLAGGVALFVLAVIEAVARFFFHEVGSLGRILFFETDLLFSIVFVQLIVIGNLLRMLLVRNCFARKRGRWFAKHSGLCMVLFLAVCGGVLGMAADGMRSVIGVKIWMIAAADLLLGMILILLHYSSRKRVKV